MTETARHPTQSPPPPPPAAPRPLNAAALRRSWQEPRVRFWWLATFVLITIAVSFGAGQIYQWQRINSLIDKGVPVQATITEADGTTIRDRRMASTSHVTLVFDFKGQPQKVRGILEDRTEMIVVSSNVTIRVDPDDPTRWTYREKATSLIQEIIAELFLIPASLGAAIACVMTRWRVLNIWRTGDARAAIVVDSAQTALAPFSQMIRCMPRDGADRRVIRVFVPNRLGKLRRGDVLWLVWPPGKPAAAIAAAPFAS